MGNHYANVIVYNVTQEEVVNYLSSLKRTAFVSPTINKFTVIYDRDIYADFNEKLFPVSQISKFFSCAVMAVYLHDGSQLGYKLYSNGDLVDTYTSDCAENETVSKYEKSKKITEIFDCSNSLIEISTILSKSGAASAEPLVNYIDNYDKLGVEYLINSTSFPLEELRHEALTIKIGVQPCWAVGLDYNNIIYGDLNAHFSDRNMDVDEAISMLKPIDPNIISNHKPRIH